MQMRSSRTAPALARAAAAGSPGYGSFSAQHAGDLPVVRRQDFDLLGELPDLLLQVLPQLYGPPQLPPQVLDLCRQPLQRANLPLSVMALETSSMRFYVIAHLRI